MAQDHEELLNATSELKSEAAAARDEVASVQTRYVNLESYGRRNRILSGFLILLVAVLGWQQYRTNNLIHRVQHNHEAQVAACQYADRVNGENVQLWDYILSIPPAPGQAKQPPAVINAFKDRLDRTFAPQDCSKIR